MKVRIEGKYVRTGIVAFVVLACAIMFFFAIFRAKGLAAAISTVTGILTPFIYGLVMAYLLCPLYNATFRFMKKKKFLHKGKKDRSAIYSRIIASTVSVVTMFTIIIGLLWMVLPGLVDSVISIVKILPTKIAEISVWIEKYVNSIPDTKGPLGGIMNSLVDNFEKLVQNTILPGSENIITSVSTGIFGILSGIKNFIIGAIICVYFLNSKEIFAAQSRKLVFAIMNEQKAYQFLYGTHFVNKTFGKFINGKLIDSLIIGIMCFVFMSIFRWPYIMLISVIVGVTNIIPFFGPFIGAIPSALLILMVDPIKCLYFLVFILLLQQFDGNILGPKILGGSTGLPSFWVMFAILVGGGLFGFVGMVIGIPIFACIYAYTGYAVDKRLDKKGLSTDIGLYKKLDTHFDNEMNKVLPDDYIEVEKKEE